MAARVGTKVSSQLVTPDSADNYPLLDSRDVLGGYREYTTQALLAGIPAPRRRKGMLIRVTDDPNPDYNCIWEWDGGAFVQLSAKYLRHDTFLVDRTLYITADTVFTNLVFFVGASNIVFSNGATAKFLGGIQAGRRRIFSGAGYAVFGPQPQCFPEWWGAQTSYDLFAGANEAASRADVIATGVAALNTTAINAALASMLYGDCVLGAGWYWVDGGTSSILVNGSRKGLVGPGADAAVICDVAAGSTTIAAGSQSPTLQDHIRLKGFTTWRAIDPTSVNARNGAIGVKVMGVANTEIDHVIVNESATGWLMKYTSGVTRRDCKAVRSRAPGVPFYATFLDCVGGAGAAAPVAGTSMNGSFVDEGFGINANAYRANGIAAGVNGGSWGLIADGSDAVYGDIRDHTIRDADVSQCDNGFYWLGNGATSDSDIQLSGNKIDLIRNFGVKAENLSRSASFSLQGGFISHAGDGVTAGPVSRSVYVTGGRNVAIGGGLESYAGPNWKSATGLLIEGAQSVVTGEVLFDSHKYDIIVNAGGKVVIGTAAHDNEAGRAGDTRVLIANDNGVPDAITIMPQILNGEATTGISIAATATNVVVYAPVGGAGTTTPVANFAGTGVSYPVLTGQTGVVTANMLSTGHPTWDTSGNLSAVGNIFSPGIGDVQTLSAANAGLRIRRITTGKGVLQFTDSLAAGQTAAIEVDNSANMSLAAGNISLGTNTGSFGSGAGVIFVPAATTAPSTNPTGGVVLYNVTTDLRYRNSAGKVGSLGSDWVSPGYVDATHNTTSGMGVRVRAPAGDGTAKLHFTDNAASAERAFVSVDTSSNMTLSATGSVILGTVFKHKIYTVATLPSGSNGMETWVSDASVAWSSANVGSAVASGGANVVPVKYSGSWKIG